MSIDIASFRRQLREHIGLEGDDTQTLPDVDSATQTGADTYLNRSYWEILDKFPFREKEIVGTFQTVVGEDYYSTPTPFEAIQHLAIEDLVSKQHTPLDLIGKDYYEQIHVNDPTAWGKPEKYLREDTGIRLEPVPDQIYKITIRYWTVLSDLSNSNTQSPIPQAWHEVILFGGVWRAFIGANNDYVRGQAARAWQASLIDKLTPVESKEKQDTSRAGLRVIGYGDRDL